MAEAEDLKPKNPILVALWPGMGHVAVNAGVYMLAKLSMHLLVEFPAKELFDVEGVAVKDGLIGPCVFPRNRLFVWKDPAGKHDLIVFVGEAQPPVGKYAFCQRLVGFAKELGAERVYTFAAMATDMRPERRCRMFGVATDPESLEELKRLELDILKDGQIGGLNGVLLSVAAEAGMHGACLLGEIPHVFAQFPFPKASLAVLEVFTTITGIPLDLAELEEQAKEVERQLTALLQQAERSMGVGEQEQEEEAETPSFETAEEPSAEPTVAESDRRLIEELFEQSRTDRSRAYELKRELDRLGLFRQYENRFLDLFKTRQ